MPYPLIVQYTGQCIQGKKYLIGESTDINEENVQVILFPETD